MAEVSPANAEILGIVSDAFVSPQKGLIQAFTVVFNGMQVRHTFVNMKGALLLVVVGY